MKLLQGDMEQDMTGMDKMEWGGGRQWQFSASKRGGGLSDTRGGISRHKINFFLKGQLTALIFQ